MRASLLINCSQREAQEVRTRAVRHRRTVSGYILNIVMRSVELAHKTLLGIGRLPPATLRKGLKTRIVRPRTTLHFYCSADEAKQIRAAAQQRATTISKYVLSCLNRSWEAEDELIKSQKRNRIVEPLSPKV